MASARDALQKNEPVTWNFKLLAQHELDGFGGMGEGMAVQVARTDDVSVMKRAEELHCPRRQRSAQAQDRGADRIAAELHAVEFAGDRQRHHGGGVSNPARRPKPAGFELFDISVPEKPKSIRLLRRLELDLARRASAGSATANMCMAAGSAELQADARARRPVPQHRRRAQPDQARSRSAAGGCRARARATARRHPCARPPSTRAIAPTTPTSIHQR